MSVNESSAPVIKWKIINSLDNNQRLCGSDVFVMLSVECRVKSVFLYYKCWTLLCVLFSIMFWELILMSDQMYEFNCEDYEFLGISFLVFIFLNKWQLSV